MEYEPEHHRPEPHGAISWRQEAPGLAVLEADGKHCLNVAEASADGGLPFRGVTEKQILGPDHLLATIGDNATSRGQVLK